MNRVPRWRMAAASVVLAGLLFFALMFAPIYYHNLQLSAFVAELPHRVAAETTAGAPPSDKSMREWVVNRARQLNLPVTADNVLIYRSPRDARVERIDVRYFVKFDLPGYTVNLHFYPGAGSR